MIETGNLLLIHGYEYPDTKKIEQKFCLGLCDLNGKQILINLPSSQIRFPFPDLNIKSGCVKIEEANMHFFCFESGKVCTDTGFAFKEHTFLYARWAGIRDKAELNKKYNTEGVHFRNCGKVNANTISAIIECLFNAPDLSRNIRRIIAPFASGGINF